MGYTIFADSYLSGYGFINKVDTKSDLHLIQQSFEVSAPELKTNYVELPCSNGSIDATYTDAYDTSFYKDRTITFRFTAEPGYYASMEAAARAVNHAIRGVKKNIYITEGSTENHSTFYIGRPQVTSRVQNGSTFEFVITAQIEPFCYEMGESTYDSSTQTYTFAHSGCDGLKLKVDAEDDENDNIFTYSNPGVGTTTYNLGTENVGDWLSVPGLRMVTSRSSDSFTVTSGDVRFKLWKGKL